MVELIITEKPNASKRVAEALADGKPIKENYKGVPFYKVTRGNKDILVGCAVGHLFGLAEKQKSKGFAYPVFDIEWVPLYEVSKGAAFSKKYYDALRKLAKDADNFTVACDYDVEGEVIGLNVIRHICNRNDARRMKFSTLTKDDLVAAYDNVSAHLDWGQAEAGETRHYLDYYYGINISRALTSAIKAAGQFKILSTGRVQGPALKIIVDREKEIQAFKPVPFWQVELDGMAKNGEIIAWHKEDKFWDKKQADRVMDKVGGKKEGIVSTVEEKQFKQRPPVPFDLTTLQTESYRCFGISPKATLGIAQDLYTNGYISYPRTSSQKLPAALNFKKILDQLSRQKQYAEACKKLLAKGKLVPNEGKKTDPAHPAIYPTGIIPKALDDRHAKVYDLITKRFLAVFGEPATRETLRAEITVNGEIFVAQGTRTIDPQWHRLYAPYVRLEEAELPAMRENDKVSVKKITQHAKETQPPKRYTPSSIIRELEKRNLGTKATRAEIVDTLAQRNYVTGEALQATDLGVKMVAILEQHCPKIVDEELTRHFELDMEAIRERAKKKEDVLREARNVLMEILGDFKKREKSIGEVLKKEFAATREALTTLGKCPVCKQGNIALRRGKYGRFAACDKYPECQTTFSLPATGLLEVTDKTCAHCPYPVVRMIRKGKRPQEVCINKDCPSKAIPEDFVKGKKCPKCGEGELIIRKSIYGQFIACSRFPKCFYTSRGMKKEAEKKVQGPKESAGAPAAKPPVETKKPKKAAAKKAARGKTKKK